VINQAVKATGAECFAFVAALTWTMMWKLVPEQPEISAYLDRWSARPAVAKVKAIEAELVAAQNRTVS